jgi:hypothetical protein
MGGPKGQKGGQKKADIRQVGLISPQRTNN